MAYRVLGCAAVVVLLNACGALNERAGLTPKVVIGYEAGRGTIATNNLQEWFESAYQLAQKDQYLIATGNVQEVTSTREAQPKLVVPLPAELAQQQSSTSYSPAKYISSPPCVAALSRSKQPQSPSSGASSNKPPTKPNPATGSTPTAQEQLISDAREKQAETGSGCSYQAVHARQLAVAGFVLADSNCSDYFAAKGDVQTGMSFLSDLVSGGASIAGSVVGLVTGSAGVPAAVSAATGLSGQVASLTNKEFLFGQENIDDVRVFVFNALFQHTNAVLPEPDISDWTFDQAIAAIREHQEICFPPKILGLIKQAVSKAKVQAVSANGEVSAGCTSNGTATPAEATSVSLVRPTTHSASVSVAPNAQCAQTVKDQSTKNTTGQKKS